MELLNGRCAVEDRKEQVKSAIYRVGEGTNWCRKKWGGWQRNNSKTVAVQEACRVSSYEGVLSVL